MNKLIITTTTVLLLGVLALLSSCSISSDASKISEVPADEVEITEGPNGVKTIKYKKPPVNQSNINNAPSSSQNNSANITRSYNLTKGWKSISVSDMIYVEYTPALSYSPIKITCEEWLHKYVDVKVENQELIIYLINANVLKDKNIRTPIKVSLSAPPVNSIMASDLASVKVLGDLNVNGMFSALTNGVASISFKNVTAIQYISIITSGVSQITADKLHCSKLKVSLTSSSQLSVRQHINCESAVLETSGVAKFLSNGTFHSYGVTAQVSGTSNLTLKSFNGSWMELETNSSSVGNLGDIVCNKLHVQTTGVSKTEIKKYTGTTLATESNGISVVKVDGIFVTRVIADVGVQCEATFSGNADNVQFSTNNGTIDASRLKVNKAYVSINGEYSEVTIKADKIYTDD